MRTSGFVKELWRITIPIIVSSMLSTAVSSADVFMLSHVSQTALSSVSLAGQLQYVLNLFFFGLSIGTVTLCSQYKGNGDQDKLWQSAGIAWKIAMALSVSFGLFAMLLPGTVMRIFTNDSALIETGAVYLRIIGFSYILLGLTQVYHYVLRSYKEVTKSTVYSSVTLLLNVFLNAVFIFGWLGAPKLGVIGVAGATVFSRIVELILCLQDLVRRKKVSIRTILKKGEKRLQKTFITVSIPATVQCVMWGSANAVLSMFMGRLGSDAVAANSVASTVQSLATVVCFAVASGGTILLGQDLGKSQFEQAQEHAVVLMKQAFLAGILGMLVMIGIYPVILRFVALSEGARADLLGMYMILAVAVVFAAMTNIMQCGIFPAGGDTKFPMYCDSISMWLGSVLMGFLAAFVFKWPVVIAYLFMHLDEELKLTFVYLHYRKKKWVRNVTEL